jgi:DNA modification methylase/superfamily II DNA or RNA helicase
VEAVDYTTFLDRKASIVRNLGPDVAASAIHAKLFPFQRDITRWAIRKGRAAIFADTGLGKTFMQLEWARLIGGRCLVVAPLSVARQTVREGVKIGVPVYYTRSGTDLSEGVNITNYEMVTEFDAAEFHSIVLDESSILKSLDGKTRKLLTEMFAETPYRLCCTATPAPNDIAEIANHAEFLGIMSRAEMLAAFFVHDQDGWRLKGHAEEPFYKWLASWGMSVRHPSDLGYSDEGYDLPPLSISPLWVESDAVTDGALFHLGMKGIADRSRIRRATSADRVAATVRLVLNSIHADKGTESRVHAEMGSGSQGTDRSLPGADTRAEECPPTREVCKRRKAQRDGKAAGKEVAGSEPGETQEPETACIRNHLRGVLPADGETIESVCDLRCGEDARREDVPCGRSLSPDGEGEGAALHELQSGPREVQGRSSDTEISSGLPGDQWLIWCGLNDEQDRIAKLLSDHGISFETIYGSLSLDEKRERVERWQDGKSLVMISKPKVLGFGMNFQNCHRMAFIGISDSWESYYQCVRRCYRFGQTEPVEALIVVSKQEREVWENVQRKDAEATKMSERLVEHVREFERAEITDGQARAEYTEDTIRHDGWEMVLGDSVETMARVEDNSVGLSVFSPPFQSLYTYSPSERDLGNSKTRSEFFEHFTFIIDHLLRVTKPGRNCAVHVQQLTTTMVTHGVIGMQDFRGDVIRAFIDRGWIYHGEVCIDKDPQAQAIRTHSKGLLFVQLRKDSTWSRPALADYIVLFRKPGENGEVVHPDITNDQWIEWARPIWYGIKESDTLNAREATQDKDERHICPLQLETIERCIRLWSNKGDLVLSPFAGIGSEGYQAVKLGRRFWGCELKRSYWETACRNIRQAETIVDIPLFEPVAEEV